MLCPFSLPMLVIAKRMRRTHLHRACPRAQRRVAILVGWLHLSQDRLSSGRSHKYFLRGAPRAPAFVMKKISAFGLFLQKSLIALTKRLVSAFFTRTMQEYAYVSGQMSVESFNNPGSQSLKYLNFCPHLWPYASPAARFGVSSFLSSCVGGCVSLLHVTCYQLDNHGRKGVPPL